MAIDKFKVLGVDAGVEEDSIKSIQIFHLGSELLHGLLISHVQFVDFDCARPAGGAMKSRSCFIASGYGPHGENDRRSVQSEEVTDGFISYSPIRSGDNDCLPTEVVSGDWRLHKPLGVKEGESSHNLGYVLPVYINNALPRSWRLEICVHA